MLAALELETLSATICMFFPLLCKSNGDTIVSQEFELPGTRLEMLDPSGMDTVTPDGNATTIFQVKQQTSTCVAVWPH